MHREGRSGLYKQICYGVWRFAPDLNNICLERDEENMASKIRVNTGTLNQTRQTVQSRLSQIKKGMQQIEADMAALNAMWTGDAHNTFTASIATDLKYLQSACDGVQKVINYESNAVTEYNKCEQQVSEIISQIRI